MQITERRPDLEVARQTVAKLTNKDLKPEEVPGRNGNQGFEG